MSLRARLDTLATNIAKPNLLFFSPGRNLGYAGDLDYYFAVFFDLAGHGQRIIRFNPGEFEAGEFAVHLAAGANTLHNLLADIASFSGIQSLILLGFLGQIALTDILPVFGDAAQDAPGLQGCSANRLRPSLFQQRPQWFDIDAAGPDFIPAGFLLRAPRNADPEITHHQIAKLKRLQC